ncbi:hypothetical protein PAMA_017968 [Pampus argenteus]
MATRRRRKPPLQDAIEYAARGVDKMAELEVEYINSFKDVQCLLLCTLVHKLLIYSELLFQAEEQSCAANPCDTEDPRTAEKMAESPSSSVMQFSKSVSIDELLIYSELLFQAEEQSCAANPCDTEDPRTAEKMAESPSSSVMQFSKSVSIDELLIYSELLFQAEEQSCAANPCDTEDPRTAEKMAESPSSSVMQDLDEPELVLSTNRFGIMSHLVDYSDSDKSQGPWTSPSQLNESCQMKGQIDLDSDELFDLTSDDSGEEYIPTSSRESSEDTDTSEIIVSVDQKMNRLRFPNMGKRVDVRNVCQSLQELENTSLKAINERGRSPIRKESTSGRRRRGCSSSVSCPTTQPSTADITKQSEGGDTGALLENSAPDLEQKLPDSSSSLENVHLDSDHERDPDAPCDPEAAYESDSLENPVTTENETTGPDVSTPQKDTVTQTHPNKSLKSLKGRQHSKRMWEKEEVAAVERHMMSFITSCRVPGKADCDKCLNMEKTALKNRNWLAIKFYVKNRITALKKKL